MVEASEYDAENRLARDAAASLRHGVETVATTGALHPFRRLAARQVAPPLTFPPPRKAL